MAVAAATAAVGLLIPTPRRLSFEQLGALKGQSNQAPGRDEAVFLVLLYTSLRVSELLALNRGNSSGRRGFILSAGERATWTRATLGAVRELV